MGGKQESYRWTESTLEFKILFLSSEMLFASASVIQHDLKCDIGFVKKFYKYSLVVGSNKWEEIMIGGILSHLLSSANGS